MYRQTGPQPERRRDRDWGQAGSGKPGRPHGPERPRLTVGVAKEAWPLRKELETDRLRLSAALASSAPTAECWRWQEREEDEEEEGEAECEACKGSRREKGRGQEKGGQRERAR